MIVAGGAMTATANADDDAVASRQNTQSSSNVSATEPTAVANDVAAMGNGRETASADADGGAGNDASETTNQAKTVAGGDHTGSQLVDESFKNTDFGNAGNWIKAGNACLTARANACTYTQDSSQIQGVGNGKGYLQLTDNSSGKSGAVLYNQAIPSRQGLDITFDEYMYHTTSQGDYGSTGADGMSFFLADGAATLDKPGAAGAGLGYASKDDDTTDGLNDKEEGIAQGVLGIGLDMFGNFSKEHAGNREVGGESCPKASGGTSDSVTLRGAGAMDSSGKWMDGYCRLDTRANAGLETGSATAEENDTNGKTVRIVISALEEGQQYQTVTVWINGKQVTSYQLTYQLPTTIKFGFSASTGGNHQVHLVRGLTAYSVTPVSAISVTKQVDKDQVPAWTQDYAFKSGDTVPYKFTVTNGGKEQLTNVTVSDPLITNVQCPAALNPLDPGESVTCTGALVLTDAQAAAGSLTNTVTATGTASDGTTLTDTDSVTIRTLAGLGTPEHRKWVEKVSDMNDTYTLNLDVKGNESSSSTTIGRGADVVVVFDKSGSMEGTRLTTAKTAVKNLANALLTAENSKLEADKQVQMSIVQFSTTAGNASTFTTSANSIASTVDAISANGGTNWEAGLKNANAATSGRDGVAKYIVFVSDGNPTYRVTSYPLGCGGRNNHCNPDGGSKGHYGEGDKDSKGYNYDAAVAEANRRGAGVTLFSVSSATEASKMGDFATATKGTYFDGSDSKKLIKAFSDIAQTITSSSSYTIQSIQDTLSEWVNPAWNGELATHIKVYKNDKPLTGGWNASYDATSKKVTVTFDPAATATKNDTFRIAFNIKPNDEAYGRYASAGYPSGSTGDPGTGDISAGKSGFYTNADASVSYCVVTSTNGSGGTSDCKSSDYAKPVIPVVKGALKVVKRWVDASGKAVSEPGVKSVAVTVKQGDAQYAQGTLTSAGPDDDSTKAEDNWTWSKSVAVGSGSKTYTVEEQSLPGWNPTYEISVAGEATANGNTGVTFTGGAAGQSATITITNHRISTSALPLTGGPTGRDWLSAALGLGGLALLLAGASSLWMRGKRLI